MQTQQPGYCSPFYSTRPSWSSFSKPSLADEIIAIISRCMYVYGKESITNKSKVLHQTRVSSIFDASAVLGHSLRFDSTLKSFESFAWHSNQQASKCSSASGSMMTKCNSSQTSRDRGLVGEDFGRLPSVEKGRINQACFRSNLPDVFFTLPVSFTIPKASVEHADEKCDGTSSATTWITACGWGESVTDLNNPYSHL